MESILSISVDDELQARAKAVLDGIGLSETDAVRILFSRIVEEGTLPLMPTEQE